MPEGTDRHKRRQSYRLGLARARVQTGGSHNPFEALGIHETPDHKREVSVFLPAAESAQLKGVGKMQRIPGSDIFVCRLKPDDTVEPHFRVTWEEKGSGAVHEQVSPYSFEPQISEFDEHLFREGHHQHAWKFLGARLHTIDGIAGCQFAV